MQHILRKLNPTFSMKQIRKIASPPCGTEKGGKEKMMADGKDFCITGKLPAKRLDKTIFSLSSTFFAGPVPLKLGK